MHVINFLPLPRTSNAIKIRRDRGAGVGGDIKGSVPIIIALAGVCNRTAAPTERTLVNRGATALRARGAGVGARGCGRRGGALGNNCLTRFQPAPGASINRRVAAGTNYMPTFLVTPFAYICQVRWRERTDVRSGTERNGTAKRRRPFRFHVPFDPGRAPSTSPCGPITECNVQRAHRIRDRIPPDVALMSLN